MTVKNDLDAGVKNFTPDAAPRTVKSPLCAHGLHDLPASEEGR